MAVSSCWPNAHAVQSAALQGTAVDAALIEQVRALTSRAARTATAHLQADAGSAPRIDIAVGVLDARLKLAPCLRIEPYVPTGVRLWGRARIGLRCTEGARRWNVYLPVTVHAYGSAWVAAAALAAGTTLQAADITAAEVDLAEDADADAAITTQALAVGRVLARPLAAGRALRLTDFKPRLWFAAGDTVRVLATGVGFSVASSGQALTAGLEGQAARVRTDSGQVVVGMPVAARQIEIAL